ncbi:MAG: hypothetical protein PUE59_10015 [Treponema sp.]|nr:hypothetical protein [Treponema sp.]MDD6655349.1 hypothetical protein [Treponema sp.]
MKISKKVWLSALAGIVLASGVSAQSITLTNIFGGDADNLYSNDFITLTKDDDGNLTKENVNVADRLQLDFKGDKILGRVRLEAKTGTVNGKLATNFDTKDSDIRLRGFVGFNPWEFLTIAGGNSFFTKYSLSAAYLAASDDQESHGNLLDTNGAGVIFNFAGLKIAGGVAAESRLNLNLAASYDIKDVVSLGFTFQDVTTEAFSFAGYAGLNAVENLILNVGYIYNHEGGYLASAEQAVQFSAGYTFKDIGLTLLGDFQTGLSKKSAKDKEGGYTEYDRVPLYTKVVAGISPLDNLDVSLAFTLSDAGLNVVAYSFYPYIDYDTGLGTIRTGARFNFADSDFNSIDIPLSWTYKFKIK